MTYTCLTLSSFSIFNTSGKYSLIIPTILCLTMSRTSIRSGSEVLKEEAFNRLQYMLNLGWEFHNASCLEAITMAESIEA